MVQEETRKGPWTEQEDLQLMHVVGHFGERRWDFIAKVSGLNRTGKSCRLRWVNYLHPGLKRERMTPQEEHLVIELHSKWGNRWSRIARKLPGRTDNEIKNYWRTHTRKKAQERKQAMSPPSSASSYSFSPPSSNCQFPSPNIPAAKVVDARQKVETGKFKMNCDKGSCASLTTQGKEIQEESGIGYSMEQIWKEIDSKSDQMASDAVDESCKEYGCSFFCPSLPSPVWDYRYDFL
ncbi:transcription factor MYB59 [Cinnamomum micranthum f. kanehirae]|uniref:Transcription factor MYB59 n=1 Tax=Cinnamomum micranthum f. kanehirae TaxID=337451 RepID=A0A3S3Q1C7_9MAGN|nr:transcription factor MYB59 [Cinnamomum micranthum f. kanehirae]